MSSLNFGHAINNENRTCDAGHAFGLSLKCQIEDFAFTTKLDSIGFMGLASRKLNCHMTASHPRVNSKIDQEHNYAGGLQAESYALHRQSHRSIHFQLHRTFM